MPVIARRATMGGHVSALMPRRSSIRVTAVSCLALDAVVGIELVEQISECPHTRGC